MLEKFKKHFFKPTEGNPDMSVEQPVVEASAVTPAPSAEAFAAQFAELQAAFAEQSAQLAAIVAGSEAVQAALKAAEDANAKLVADAYTKKMADRRVAVEAAIGTSKVDSFLSATESLDDAAFEAVTSSLAGSLETESKSAMFTEVGVDAKAEPNKAVTESTVMQILEKKYPSKSAK